MKLKSPSARRAFSLVEVTITIGILAFCLLSLVGLMPVGLSTVKNAREQAAAANCVNFLATAIRKASPDASGTNFTALGEFSDSLVWSVGGRSNEVTLSTLSLGGRPAANLGDQRLTAHIEIQPPTSLAAAGTARISVAWPGTAVWTTNSGWKNAQGSVSSWLVFLPRQ